MEEDWTIIQTPVVDTDEGPLTITVTEVRDNLNL